ncbi:MAG: glycosyltransferase family 9 protein [Verrucomicrobiota bacterium]
MTRGKILVIRGGAIRDFILTLPVLAALRQQFPQAHLEVLGYPHIVPLAQVGGLVDRVQAIEARGLASFFARKGELPEELRDYFSEFNIIVSYLYDPDGIFQENVQRCSPGQIIVGRHQPDEAERVHATQVYLKPLERLAIFDADTVPRLTLEPQSSTRNPVLALHPGSGSEHKNWPEQKWAELINQLLGMTDLNLLLVGGEAEGNRLQKLAAALPPTRTSVARNLPLTELARRLQTCVGFVGHDSGITHLAAAVGLPCVVLWAHTMVEIWRPQGERVQILQDTSGLSELSVARVMTALQPLL